jgi:hypothetical protein
MPLPPRTSRPHETVSRDFDVQNAFAIARMMVGEFPEGVDIRDLRQNRFAAGTYQTFPYAS